MQLFSAAETSATNKHWWW